MSDKELDEAEQIEYLLLSMRQTLDILASILDKRDSQKITVPDNLGTYVEIDMGEE